MAAPWARADAVHGWLMVLTATLCSSLSCLWCLGCFCFRVMLETPCCAQCSWRKTATALPLAGPLTVPLLLDAGGKSSPALWDQMARMQMQPLGWRRKR